MSLLYDLADASATEIAMIGKEGLLGIAVFMGGLHILLFIADRNLKHIAVNVIKLSDQKLNVYFP
jgi:hypothetical protein